MNKFLTLTTVALLGTTSLVAAQETTAVNAFSLQEVQEADGVLELGTVTIEADGMIEIYEIDDAAMANLLGSQVVTAGTNTDVKVTLLQQPLSDVMAVLKIGDVVVAQQEIDLEEGAGGGDDSGAGEGEDDDDSDVFDDSGDDAGGDDAAGDDTGGDAAGGDDAGGDDAGGDDTGSDDAGSDDTGGDDAGGDDTGGGDTGGDDTGGEGSN